MGSRIKEHPTAEIKSQQIAGRRTFTWLNMLYYYIRDSMLQIGNQHISGVFPLTREVAQLHVDFGHTIKCRRVACLGADTGTWDLLQQ
jgi:hypothetical protein